MPKKLPYQTFLKTFKYAPRVGVNLLIKDQQGKILLTKRAKDPFKGYWHFPGAFILKGETIMDCLSRLAREELGVDIKDNQVELLGVFDDINKDSRGHVVDIVYGTTLKSKTGLKPTGDTRKLKFFHQIPSKIGFNHRQTLTELGYF